jgi:hypothetical protein
MVVANIHQSSTWKDWKPFFTVSTLHHRRRAVAVTAMMGQMIMTAKQRSPSSFNPATMVTGLTGAVLLVQK